MNGSPVVPYGVAIVITLLLGMVGGGVLVWWLLRNLWWEPLERVGRQLESQLAHAKAENRWLGGRLRRTAQHYTQELRQHQQTAAQKAAVQIELARLEERTRDLTARLEESHGRLAAQQHILQESQDKLSELQLQRAGAMAKHEAQVSLIAQLQQERQMWQAEIGLARQAAAEAQREIGRMGQLAAEKTAVQTELERVRQQLSQREQGHESLVQQLVAFSQQTGALQAELTAAQTHLANQKKIQHALTEAQEEILDLEQAVAQHKRDNLQEIDGVGPVFAKRLYAAGIDSFAKIAQTPVPILREIVQLKAWQAADIESWREQAQARSNS